MTAGELLTLGREVRGCHACRLRSGCTAPVTWRGTPRPGVVLFIGEAPGADEDRAGKPFVGRSGKLLQSWIDGPLKLRPGEYLIANAVNCFPNEAGRPVPPPAESIAACRPFLVRLIAAVQPVCIVALGRSAERALREAGVHDFVFHYHPAYYLRTGAPWGADVARLGEHIARKRA